jgi:hypothetical protein
MGNSKLAQTEKGEAVEVQSREHVHHFLSQQGDCSEIIRPGRPNSQFRILLGILRRPRKNMRKLRT